jgi:hypothetical protein
VVIVVGVPRSELVGSGSLSLWQNHVTRWCCNLFSMENPALHFLWAINDACEIKLACFANPRELHAESFDMIVLTLVEWIAKGLPCCLCLLLSCCTLKIKFFHIISQTLLSTRSSEHASSVPTRASLPSHAILPTSSSAWYGIPSRP